MTDNISQSVIDGRNVVIDAHNGYPALFWMTFMVSDPLLKAVELNLNAAIGERKL